MADKIEYAGKFRKSSSSSTSCVEVAPLVGGGAAVRDSKDCGSGPVLLFTPSEWIAFTTAVRAGELGLD